MINSSIEFIEFKPWHLLGIENPNHDAQNFFEKSTKQEIINYGLYAMSVAPKYLKPVTCIEFETGKVIGCGGISQLNDFTAEAWLILDTSLKEHKLTVIKFIKKKLNEIQSNRIQCYVNDNLTFKKAIYFARFLGFQQEAVLEKAGNHGNDLILFKRFKQCN